MTTVRTGNAVHYRCHTGHSFSPQAFLTASDEGIETALWTALSAMQEKTTVLEEMAARARAAGDEARHREYHAAAGEVRRAAGQFRRHVLGDREPRSAPVSD